MNNLTNIVKILAECRHACGEEASPRGFPPEAGYDMYDGCYVDALQTRTEKQVSDWIDQLNEKYGCNSSVESNSLMELYEACSQSVKSYLALSQEQANSLNDSRKGKND